jgi:membrane-associated phospholipid phosphatase
MLQPCRLRFRGVVCSLALVLLVASAGSSFAQGVAPDIDATIRTAAAGAAVPLDGSRAFEGRTLRAFPRSVGRGLGSVLDQRSVPPLIAAAVATASAGLFDGSTRSFFARHRHERFGDMGGTFGGAVVSTSITAGLFVGGRLARNERFRAATYDMASAFVANAALTMAVKQAVQRPRPDGSSRLSFPSGHTSSAFALAAVANAHYGARAGVPAYVAAGLIGASRLAKHKHYLSDVTAGASLGWIVGRSVVRKNGGVAERRTRRRAFSIAPLGDAQGGGAGIALSIAF